jgi:maleamate amidohydrolase
MTGASARPRLRPAAEYLDDVELDALHRAGYGGRSGLGERPALLVVDVTYGFCGEAAAPTLIDAIETYPHASGPAAWAAVPHIAAVVGAARGSDVPVVFTRPAPPTDGRRRDSRWADKNRRQHDVPDRAYDIVTETGVTPSDALIDKEAPSAFFGTPLLRWLIRAGVDSVIVCGGTTSGCVRATAVDAFSYDLRVAVVEEATFDRVRASHHVGLFDLDLKYGDVLPSQQVVDHLRATAATPV